MMFTLRKEIEARRASLRDAEEALRVLESCQKQQEAVDQTNAALEAMRNDFAKRVELEVSLRGSQQKDIVDLPSFIAPASRNRGKWIYQNGEAVEVL
jgi:hypothetical protein